MEISHRQQLLNKLDDMVEERRKFIYSEPRTAMQRMNDALNMPDIRPLCSCVWMENELHLLFADTGIGKSIMAMGISIALSKGFRFLNLDNENEPKRVLYYDFELSDRQFFKRYTSDIEENKAVSFPDTFFIDTINFLEVLEANPSTEFIDALFNKIEFDLAHTKAEVLIIDNLTYLDTQNTSDGQTALNVMRKLNELKKEHNLSILVLAHTPKRSLSSPLTINDLAGSKHLSNFADSVSAIGKSTQGESVRYWKQVKPSRSAEVLYHSDNVIVCEIIKNNTALTFDFVEFGNEYEHLTRQDNEAKNYQKQQAIDLKQEGKSVRDIATELGVAKSTVGNWLKN